MRGSGCTILLVAFSFFFSSSIGAEPEKKPADYKNKAHAYVDNLKVCTGFMPLDTFNRKWKSDGQIRKSKDKVVKFHAEIKQYNRFRSGYNALAVELAKFLYRRNPKEVKVLIKDIDLLLVDLQRAIDDKEYTKAVLIASRSTVATEFGF